MFVLDLAPLRESDAMLLRVVDEEIEGARVHEVCLESGTAARLMMR